MGFVYERVPREEWELYNSFELVYKTGENEGKKDYADESSSWYVDRERNAYFIMTGVLGREEVRYYTLMFNGKKINIVACFERIFGETIKMGYRVSTLIVDKKLQGQENEYMNLIKEALQLGWDDGLDFIEFVELVYRDEVR